MNRDQAMLLEIETRAPCSMRKLADEAGVSERLLRLIRDGERRLTPATRDALAAALLRWGERCEYLAKNLQSLDVGEGGDHV